MPRYDELTLNNGDYIPQYAGVPLEQVRRTADTLSDRHYSNLAKLNQLQLVAEQYKSKMLPGAKPYVDQHINDISTALQDIAANGGENSTARVSAMANRFLGDQGILAGLQTSEAVNKEIEMENRLLAENKTPLRKRGVREAIMNSPVIDPATGQLATPYTSPYVSTLTQYENPVPHMEQIWNNIKPDSIEGALKGADSLMVNRLLGEAVAGGLPDIPLFFESLTKAGIGGQKIKDQLNNAWSSYQQTPAFKQAMNYADDPAAELKRQKDQLYRHGLLGIFENISRQYMGNPIADDLLRGNKTEEVGQVTTAPGNITKSLFPYGEDGKINQSNFMTYMENADIGQRKGLTADQMARIRDKDRNPEFHEQFVKDWRTMAEIKGVNPNNIKNDSQLARDFAKEYQETVRVRVANPYVQTVDPDRRTKIDASLESEYGLYEYMDPISGKVFTPFDANGEPTDDFIEITGGKPKSFRMESYFDAKNHYSSMAKGSQNWARPIAVVAEDADGNPKRFLISQLPKNTTVEETNTNVIYNTANLRPGQWQEINPRVKVKELYGAQFNMDSVPEDSKKYVNMPLEATVDGVTMRYFSPEHLAKDLKSRGIILRNK